MSFGLQWRNNEKDDSGLATIIMKSGIGGGGIETFLVTGSQTLQHKPRFPAIKYQLELWLWFFVQKEPQWLADNY